MRHRLVHSRILRTSMALTLVVGLSPIYLKAAPQHVQITQSVAQGLLLTKVDPIYPPLARQARIQSTVVLRAQISKEGSIEQLTLVSGHPMLVQAAIDAVKQWKYKPYVLNSEPVEVETEIRVNFTLSPSGPPPSGNTAPDAQIGGVAGTSPKPEESSGASGAGRGPITTYHRGEGASDPRIISQVDPEFSEKARKANYQGLCVLSLIVEPDGTPSNIRVVSKLGMGLDEKAVEAVKQWRFLPSMKDGHPVRYGPVEVDVDFHLYKRP
jgi:TonB family protein